MFNIIPNGSNSKEGDFINNKGFTLIELLIVIAIFGIVFVAFITLFSNSFSFIAYSSQKAEAIGEAKDILERINVLSKDIEDFSLNTIKGRINQDRVNIVNRDEILNYSKDKTNICFDDTITIKNTTIKKDNKQVIKVTAVSFYNNGKKHIEISSYIITGGK